ncbi:MAG: hypothetical protein AB1743_09505 [Actinomycetota bacterium]
MAKVLAGLLAGVIITLIATALLVNYSNLIIMPVDAKKALSNARHDNSINKWIKKNFKIRQAVKPTVRLEWKSDNNNYIWHVILTEAQESCCGPEIPAKIDVFVDTKTGKISEKVFKKAIMLPKNTEPSCKDACHSLYDR